MILLIEDEEILRFTFKSFLSKEGYEVVSAEDYNTALEIISATDLDLIIADIILKGHTGLDILKEVRARDMQCPVIMITGQPSVETAAESVRLGAYDYLPKPVEKQDLIKITNQALRYYSITKAKDRMEDEKEKYRSELDTIFRLGCSRLTSVQLLGSEILIIVLMSGVLVAGALLVVNVHASELVHLLIIR